jgi:hypothetical protein
MMFMRSLAVIVSNAKLSGAICTRMLLRGTDVHRRCRNPENDEQRNDALRRFVVKQFSEERVGVEQRMAACGTSTSRWARCRRCGRARFRPYSQRRQRALPGKAGASAGAADRSINGADSNPENNRRARARRLEVYVAGTAGRLSVEERRFELR